MATWVSPVVAVPRMHPAGVVGGRLVAESGVDGGGQGFNQGGPEVAVCQARAGRGGEHGGDGGVACPGWRAYAYASVRAERGPASGWWGREHRWKRRHGAGWARWREGEGKR